MRTITQHLFDNRCDGLLRIVLVAMWASACVVHRYPAGPIPIEQAAKPSDVVVHEADGSEVVLELAIGVVDERPGESGLVHAMLVGLVAAPPPDLVAHVDVWVGRETSLVMATCVPGQGVGCAKALVDAMTRQQFDASRMEAIDAWPSTDPKALDPAEGWGQWALFEGHLYGGLPSALRLPSVQITADMLEDAWRRWVRREGVRVHLFGGEMETEALQEVLAELPVRLPPDRPLQAPVPQWGRQLWARTPYGGAMQWMVGISTRDELSDLLTLWLGMAHVAAVANGGPQGPWTTRCWPDLEGCVGAGTRHHGISLALSHPRLHAGALNEVRAALTRFEMTEAELKAARQSVLAVIDAETHRSPLGRVQQATFHERVGATLQDLTVQDVESTMRGLPEQGPLVLWTSAEAPQTDSDWVRLEAVWPQ